MSISLPPLPYDYSALEPQIGRRTVEIHHDKHHAKYVATANTMIQGTPLENSDLVTIIKSKAITMFPLLFNVCKIFDCKLLAAKAEGNAGLFNNSAQVWNHTFYWECMKQGGGGEPTGSRTLATPRLARDGHGWCTLLPA
jgi:Fe-Mn family superoxide dismutase